MLLSCTKRQFIAAGYLTHEVCAQRTERHPCASQGILDSDSSHRSDRFEWRLDRRLAGRLRRRILFACTGRLLGYSLGHLIHHGRLHGALQILCRIRHCALVQAEHSVRSERITQKRPVIIEYNTPCGNRGEHRRGALCTRHGRVPSNKARAHVQSDGAQRRTCGANS